MKKWRKNTCQPNDGTGSPSMAVVPYANGQHWGKIGDNTPEKTCGIRDFFRMSNSPLDASIDNAGVDHRPNAPLCRIASAFV
jgi:hypothetical protein